jgi:outer membrane receptor for ferrienterochelin and colicin
MSARIGVTGLICCLIAADAGAQHVSVLTDTLGRFLLIAPRAGDYELRAIRLGYATTVVPSIAVLGSETVDVELSLAVAAIPLEPLRVVARGRTISRYLSDVGFYDREQNGVGSFLTRYEIEKRGGFQLSDVLRSVSGVRLVRADRTGRRWDVRLRNRRCSPSIYLDGTIVRASGTGRPTDMPMDDLVLSVDIDGIEIYHGPSESPAEFNRDANCGVIALWTRRRR